MVTRKPLRRVRFRQTAEGQPRRRRTGASLTSLLGDIVAALAKNRSASALPLHDAIAALEIAAFVADDHAHLIETNTAASVLTGYSDRELRGLSVYDITGEHDVDVMEVLWRAFLQQRRQSGRYQIQTKSGKSITVEYAAAANVSPGCHLSLLRRVERRKGRKAT